MPADDGLHGMPAEDLAAFLRDLRALREREGLSLDGLATRADIPLDTLAAAESGPVRPAMPVLEAYVRGCGASAEAWRGRWRSLAPGTGSELAVQQPAPDGLASQPEFAITRLSMRPRPWRPSPALTGVVAAAVVLGGLAAGGALLLSHPVGHSTAGAPAAPSRGNGRSMAASGGRMRMRMRTVLPGRPSLGPAPASPGRGKVPGKTRVRMMVPGLVRPAGAGTEVAGVGCPDSPDDGISLADASTGPGWAAAGGGWTGNGCDGSAVWTMDPNGNQASPSTLTWFFYPSMQASSCRLAVFVPSQNALGTGNYQVSAGSASLGSVSIDQSGNQGEWVPLGRYPATGGMLTVQLLPGTATLTAATSGNGQGGNGNRNGGNGNRNGGTGDGNGGTGHGGSGGGPVTPTPSPAFGHNAAVAASAARASCH